MSNTISVYQNNTRSVICYISSSLTLTDYDTYLSVKKVVTDASMSMASTGSLNLVSGSYTGSFALTQTDTSMATGAYTYELSVESGSNRYTVIRDDFIIQDSVLH